MNMQGNLEVAGTDGETFAEYLARYYIHKRGFKPGTVPEAQALAASGGVVLTKADGLSFSIVALVDAEKHPGKRFELPAETVREIARQCLQYTGKVNNAKMPASVTIIEVGAGIDSDAERTRLQEYKRKSIWDKGVVSAWIVDVAAAAVWANTFAGRLGRGWIQKLLREPRSSDEQMRRPAVAAQLGSAGFPWLTWTLLAILVAVFGCEVAFRLGWGRGIAAPDLRTLVALGALDHGRILHHGEWYRLLSATMLHVDAIHLGMNGIALVMVGYVLERMIGRAWLMAAFVLGGLGGSLMSLALNSAEVVSVGASGAIMALFACAFACSFHFPDGPGRVAVQMPLLRVLVPSLLPLATAIGHKVDIGAHLGGALTGTALGLALLRMWAPEEVRPRGNRFATVMAILGLAGFVAAAIPVYNRYPSWQLLTQLIPQGQQPRSDADGIRDSEKLVHEYPHDPRSHIYRAMALANAHDLPDAESELLEARNAFDDAREFFKPELGQLIDRDLAKVQAERNSAAASK